MKLKKKWKLVRPKTKLGLPDLEQAKAAVIGSLASLGHHWLGPAFRIEALISPAEPEHFLNSIRVL